MTDIKTALQRWHARDMFNEYDFSIDYYRELEVADLRAALARSSHAPVKSVGEDAEFLELLGEYGQARLNMMDCEPRDYARADLIAHIDSLLAAGTVADAAAEPVEQVWQVQLFSYECVQPGTDGKGWAEFYSRKRPAEQKGVRNIRSWAPATPVAADQPAHDVSAIRDAERYQFLRDSFDGVEFRDHNGAWRSDCPNGEELDAILDDAIRSQPAQQGDNNGQ